MATHEQPPSQRLPGTHVSPTDYGNWCKSWADNRRWGEVWFSSVWGDTHRDLDYIHEPFNDPVTQAEWESRGFEHQHG